MYLVVGDRRDPCVAAVCSALERRGLAALATTNPFLPPNRLSWRFDTASSRLDHAFGPGADPAGCALDGVFVRYFVALGETAGWAADDASYVNAETTAAMLAWLHALPCQVVGRASDDAWYRPLRALPEWTGTLAACGLPTPTVVVTSAPDPAALPGGWKGRATYHPLTSPRRYEIDGTAWPELARVAEHVPVCLCEPLDGPIGAVTLAGDGVFWTDVPARDRGRLEDGVRRVGARLGADFLQLSYHAGRDGPAFTTATLHPRFDVHDRAAQDGIVEAIVGRLLAGVTS